MPANLIDGKALAAQVRAALGVRVASLGARGVRPGLAVLVAGSDPASHVYVRNKVRACEETGVRSTLIALPAAVSEAELLARIEVLNADPLIHGILVQLPLPATVRPQAVLDAIDPAKDVDGFHPSSLGALLAGRPGFVPCTPAGILALIDHAEVPLAGHHAVVIGRSNIVGKPVALLLLQRDATVTICHSKSRDLAAHAREADVLVAAAGRAGLVDASMVKPGACVIDVGIHRDATGRLVGDVNAEAVRPVAGWMTPVPGGVGPMTVAMLISNCVQAAEARLALHD